MNWTQPICEQCFTDEQPDREPHRIVEDKRERERCCLCGEYTKDGIYVRKNPNTVPYASI